MYVTNNNVNARSFVVYEGPIMNHMAGGIRYLPSHNYIPTSQTKEICHPTKDMRITVSICLL